MHYEEFTFIDFLKDEFFRSWVLKPDYENNLFWQNWIAKHPDKINDIDKARSFILGIRYQEQQPMPEEDFDQIHENIIRFQNEHHFKTELAKHRKGKSATFWYVAATVLLIGLIAGVANWVNETGFSAPQDITIAYKTNQAPAGAKKTFVLSDGTRVKLNSESSLRFPDTFSGNYREVYLQGEAFFEVAENSKQSFLIHSTGFITEVKGTSFNIRAYLDEPQKIAVITGLVEVYVPGKEATSVYPQQMATLNSDSSRFEITSYDPVKELGWHNNILHFDNEKLLHVFQKLERWYGIEIEVSNASILKEIYQGEYKDESLHNVLTGISFTTGFQFEIEEKKVFIK